MNIGTNIVLQTTKKEKNMYKLKILLIIVITISFTGCVKMAYPEWSKNGFQSEGEIRAWQNCGINNPNDAMAYKNCGIPSYEAGWCKSNRMINSVPKYQGISPEKACQWNQWMAMSGENIYDNKELRSYVEAGIEPNEVMEWRKLFKLQNIKAYEAYYRLTKGKKGIDRATLVKKAKINNLTPSDLKKWAQINKLQGWKYIDQAGAWKKYGITFDELSNAVIYITIHENQFKKTTPELAKKHKLDGYKFSAIYFGLENNINIKDLSELKDKYNIDYKKGIILLKYFSVNKASILYKNMTQYILLLGEYSFEKNVENAHSLIRDGMKIQDVSSWLKYYNPKNKNDITTAISYYHNKIPSFTAKNYKDMHIDPNRAKQYEKTIAKNCKDFTWSTDNPFDMKGKCYKLKTVKQIVLLSQSSGIYINGESWIKIKSKGSAPKYFSGVVKINGTNKFTTPEGLITIIPMGQVVVHY